jgi:hypothetical protein
MELFKSADQAALFAYRFSSQQYPQSPMAKQMQKLGMASIGQGKGLSGLDGSAQAGIIKARIERIDPLQRACIVATFSARIEPCSCCGADKPLDEYKEAVATLTEWAGQFMSSLNKAAQATLHDALEGLCGDCAE